MDQNGTRFHLLLGEADWAGCTLHDGTTLRERWDASPPGANGSGFDWHAERAELTLETRLFRFAAPKGDNRSTITDRRGAGRDAYGNWYWIAPSNTEILVNSSGSGATSHFWSSADDVPFEPTPLYGEFGPRSPARPPTPHVFGGLAVTEDHYLVVGVLKSDDCPAGLLVFDLHAGGPPRRIWWPDTVKFVPFDMAAAPGGGVWVLDRENSCYWALDRFFNVTGPEQPLSPPDPSGTSTLEPFQPLDRSEQRRTTQASFPGSFSVKPLGLLLPLDEQKPSAIEALPDGTVLVLYPAGPLNANFSEIRRFRYGDRLGEPVTTQGVCDLFEEKDRDGCRPVAHDIAFVPAHQAEEPLPDRLYVASHEGNQTFAFDVTLQGEQLFLKPLDDYYLPMRLFSGKALVAAGNAVYYDMGDRWIQLIEQKRPRYTHEATLYSPLNVTADETSEVSIVRGAFDGKVPDCVWHRLMLDACIPPDTEVEISSRAANTQAELQYAAWRPEPKLYLRGDGSELPFARGGRSGSALGDGTWELLFQEARGRYVQLRLTLRGNGRNTPRLRNLRAYYPRFSYLEHYLPAVYREDAQSASFLDRFLANLEGIYTGIEGKIAAAQLLFDVRSAPKETLEWLASWFDVALDPAWDERKRRLFIEHAVTFFAYRGTIRGLSMALHLAFDQCVDSSLFTGEGRQNGRRDPIRIVEKYRTRQTPALVFGDPTQATGLRTVSETGRWQPTEGRDVLNSRYQDALREALVPSSKVCTPGPSQADCETQYRDLIDALPFEAFPLREPNAAEGKGKGAVWRQFAQEALGFVPAGSSVDAGLWHNFLARRYLRIDELNRAYRTAWTSFENVPFPGELPPDGHALADWYRFESLALPVHAAAHRFTVLLPTPERVIEPGELARTEALARRIVDLEKPAHTIFDVQFYWSLFRLGEVRVGEDTLLGLGSRAPQLMAPSVLGHAYLAETHLGPARNAPAGLRGKQDDRYLLESGQLGA